MKMKMKPAKKTDIIIDCDIVFPSTISTDGNAWTSTSDIGKGQRTGEADDGDTEEPGQHIRQCRAIGTYRRR